MEETAEYKKVHLVSYQRSQIVKSTSLIGYCHCDTHRGYLTLSILQKHRCVEKVCPFFQKFPTAPYWQMVAEKKANKTNAIKTKKLNKKNERAECEKVKATAQELIDSLGFNDIHITRVQKSNIYKIFFVPSGECCSYDWISIVCYELRQKFKKGVYFTRIKRQDGKYATWADLPKPPR